jgi:hypothetical protein
MNLPPSSERLLTIHTGIQVVSPGESDRLTDKRIQALVWMDENPFANAMRYKLKRHLTARNYSNVRYLLGE